MDIPLAYRIVEIDYLKITRHRVQPANSTGPATSNSTGECNVSRNLSDSDGGTRYGTVSVGPKIFILLFIAQKSYF